MIATGTGIAPFLSMLKTHLGQKRWRRFVLIHGARYARDLGYFDELSSLAKAHSDVFYIPATTREAPGSAWSGLRGRVQTLLEGNTYKNAVGIELDPNETHVFLCGNPEMIDAVQAVLEARGFKEHSKKDPGNIHVERYW